MRTVELVKVATAAEALRLRRIARRQAFRAAYGVGAAVFGIALLVTIHVLIYLVANKWLSPVLSITVVLVIDLIAAAALGFLAIKSPPDPVEIEAQQIRVQAMLELKRSLTVMGLASEVVGVAFRGGSRKPAIRRGFASLATGMVSRLVKR